MAHNRSPSKIRSDVLMSPLGSFRGWLLEMECGVSACPTGRTRKVDALVAAWPDLTVLAAVLAEPRGPCRRVPLRGPECRQ